MQQTTSAKPRLSLVTELRRLRREYPEADEAEFAAALAESKLPLFVDLLAQRGPGRPANPIDPELIGMAFMMAIDPSMTRWRAACLAVAGRPERRRVNAAKVLDRNFKRDQTERIAEAQRMIGFVLKSLTFGASIEKKLVPRFALERAVALERVDFTFESLAASSFFAARPAGRSATRRWR
jgi:hypothetical protein